MRYEVHDDLGLVRKFRYRTQANTFAKKIGGIVRYISPIDWECYEPAIF